MIALARLNLLPCLPSGYFLSQNVMEDALRLAGELTYILE